MRILIVSWYLPPFNTMGALRAGKLAKYLYSQGHDVRVLSCAGLPFEETLPLEIPADRVFHTTYFEVNLLPKAVQKIRVFLGRLLRRTTTADGGAAEPRAHDHVDPDAGSSSPGLLRRLRVAYQEILNFPDPQIGWYWRGRKGGRKLLDQWKPEIIFATAPPFTTLMIGRYLSRKFAIPWVAEYRDRLYEDPYSPPTGLRKKFEKLFEDRLLRDVSALVTVSELWAEDYRKRFDLPVATIYNGFDPDDFPEDYERGTADPDILRIVYTGILYPDRRDPSPLFAALAMMGDDKAAIRPEFYGADRTVLEGMAARHGVLDQVRIHDRVPYRDSIRLQMQADVLLLLQWNDARERGNVPGKLFEYIGARRPVLGIGVEDGVPATILKQRDVGIVVNDPAVIAEKLTQWLDLKRRNGAIPLNPPATRAGLSRSEQYRQLESFLGGLADAAIR